MKFILVFNINIYLNGVLNIILNKYNISILINYFQNKQILLNSFITRIPLCVPITHGHLYFKSFNNYFEYPFSFPFLTSIFEALKAGWGWRSNITLVSFFTKILLLSYVWSLLTISPSVAAVLSQLSMVSISLPKTRAI